MFFVTREDAAKVLAACPDAQWRLLFALSRYGGLRCPSEHLGLKWGDVDWGDGTGKGARITIRSPKTEHHEGGDHRVIPLFPELRPYLQQAFDEAEPGSEFVITRYRGTNANLRTQLNRIIGRAKVKPWPKLFQNLRSTRQTELAEKYPIHVVCKWIGNSRTVAQDHYLQVTDTHFDSASGCAETRGTESGTVDGGKASEPSGTEQQAETSPTAPIPVLPHGTDDLPIHSDCYSLSDNNLVGAEGFEPSKA
jgi:Phage integrase family